MNRKHISGTIKPHLTNHKIGVLKFQFPNRMTTIVVITIDFIVTQEQHIKNKLDSDIIKFEYLLVERKLSVTQNYGVKFYSTVVLV